MADARVEEEKSFGADSHWDHFYARERSIVFPSQFACMIASYIKEPCDLIDLGCGNARDSFFFAQLGNRVLGVDRSEVAIDANKRQAETGELTFCSVDFSETKHLKKIFTDFFDETRERPRLFYCRFVLHSLTDEAEASLFSAIKPFLREGDAFAAEFRTQEDADKPKVFGEHYRRYIMLREFLVRCRQRSLIWDYAVEGTGMAYFRGEDPSVARVILTSSEF